MNDAEKQIQLARLGMDAEVFIGSPLGKYMIARAEKMIDENVTQLIECEPNDIEGNTKYRNQIQVGGLFKIFLAEIIDDGINSSNQLAEDELSVY